MKIVAIVLVVIVLIVASLFVFKNAVAKAVIQSAFEKITGSPLTIKSLALSLSPSTVDAKEITLYNPPSFPDKLMAFIPELFLDFDLKEYLQGKIHVRELRLNIATVEVVRNRQAAVNVSGLRALQPKGGGKPPQVSIDKAELTMGKVVYRDYTLGNPFVKEFNLNAHQTYTKISDPAVLAEAVVATALKATPLAELQNRANQELEKLKNRFGITLPR